MSFLRSAMLFLVALVATTHAHALTIDAYVDDGSVSSTSVVGTTKTVYLPSSKALGGGRSLSATKSGSGTGISRLEIVDSSIGYTQGAHNGYASISWDGDTDPSTIKPDGLGGVDMTQDGGTAFKIGLMFFDYPSNQPIQLKLRLYDASFANGTKYSEVAITIDQFYGGPEVFYITVPFALFSTAGASSVPAPLGLTFPTSTTVGSNGAVDITRIGAISLAFRGDLNARAPDIILAPFITNGRCSATPNSSGKALDDCSVCLESPDVNKGLDRCGVCLAGPPGYSYATNQIFDNCGLCPGERNYQYPKGITDKCGSCLSGPAPYTYVDRRDVCGVCDGKTKKKEECTVGNNGCPIVQPTAKILGFEKSLLEKASLLKTRFHADVRRSKVHKCEIDFSKDLRDSAKAFNTIKASATEIFGRGIEVCKGSCVTVSYAEEVKALTPHFKILEKVATSAAQQVKECYMRLHIPNGSSGGAGNTSQTVTDVRTGLDKLIKDCRRTSVCKKH